MNRPFPRVAVAACLLAVFLASGGHWVVLQTVAWARMLADFSRVDSWGVAVRKTFDGQHPCPLCLKIREGRARESKPPAAVKFERLPELAAPLLLPLLARPHAPSAAETPFVRSGYTEFVSAPPKPPPRTA